ncbi:MAG TPA: carbon starvation protein A [Syntrophaceae bacterium]|nr:carbon starvation protein A [Syntrophaceae bacterium]
MNILVTLSASLLVFFLGYRFYTGYIERLFNASDKNPTPAVSMSDGKDYVAGKTVVVFSHHFAAIAGGGPIVGPIVAAIYGIIPAWLWILVGSVFFGAVHDFTSLFVSMRERGKSMPEITGRTMGKAPSILFILFTIALLFLLTSAFLGITATALSSLISLKDLKFDGTQAFLKTVTSPDGVIMGHIGGVASTSVVITTICAPLIGYLLYKKGISSLTAVVMASSIAFLSVFIGISYPIIIKDEVWMVLLSIYVFLAAATPIWFMLQPRGFINSFVLYGGLVMLVLGIVCVGFKGTDMAAPLVNIDMGIKKLGPMWPMLFIIIACGAISGFHSVVAGGTTSKNIPKETDAKLIGYGAMLLEAILAIIVLLAISSGLLFKTYLNIVFPEVPGVRANPILAFSLAMGGILNQGLGIPIFVGVIYGMITLAGLLTTTLDTAVRLNRYLLEELWVCLLKNPPNIFRSYLFNTGVSVVFMFVLAYKSAFLSLWSIFGSANQLLAALSLTAVSAWLISRGKRAWFTLIPASFMMATTIASLIYLLKTKYIPECNFVLMVACFVLILLSIGLLLMGSKSIFGYLNGKRRLVFDPVLTAPKLPHR